ncbi:MAG: AbrB/MazE/SpoVT family DNA-binding domain-containing protein [Pseudomonadota bacterium]
MNARSAPIALTVGKDGRVLVPAELRRQVGMEPGGRVIAKVVGGELHLISAASWIAEARRLVGDGDPMADALINERRAEVARDAS